MQFNTKALLAATFTAALALSAPFAQAGAIREAAQFTDFSLARNDDSSTGLVNIGFSINFFGVTRTQLFVNNNGNVTLDSALSTFTPFALSSTNRQILAPFFADVDTRNTSSALTQYGTGSIGGRNAFGVNWVNVGYFPSAANKLNSFQLIMIERSDTGAGNFDFEFNFDKVEWETGGASGGTNGLGGSSARMGWSNGNLNSFEQAGSAVNGAFINGGANALISNSLNSNVAGRYVWNVRNGNVVTPPNTVPEPAGLALIGLALAGAALARRKATKAA
jgi:hypothetical protein